MALEFVGGAFLSSALQVLFAKMASPEVAKYIWGKKHTEKLLEKLKIHLRLVDAVLDDAEEKGTKNKHVEKWLDELKDVIYDADDLLDKISTKARIGSESKVRTFISTSLNFSDRKLQSEISGVQDRLEFIFRQKDDLGLKEGVRVTLSQKTPTTALVEGSEVFGRDADKEAIIKLLISDDHARGDHTCVIPIVGMGGVGKTTLAQLLYNDDRVNEKFDIKAWVYVSEDYDIFKVTKTIFELVTSQTCGSSDLNSLQYKLKERLMGKRFLFVLDDIWNENYVDWVDLQKPFQSGAQGSRIIVTTRNRQVASIMQTLAPHLLVQLSNEDCWSLFAKHAFDHKDPNANPILEEIGRKIVNKCNGLPLAAKTLGGLLRSTTDVKDWDNILKSDIWDLSNNESNILPALRLSYFHLPSHIKRCFAYCALFPKGYEFEKEKLILLWMAENLLQPGRNKRIEDVGDGYFCELVSRSFFQQSSHDRSCFLMHDLINDLAKFVSGKFSARLEDNNSIKDVETRIRYLSQVITHKFHHVDFRAFYKAIRLRTFLQLNLACLSVNFSNKVSDDLLMKLRCLRVLTLVDAQDNDHELPNSIGKLRHLRFLDVSGTKINKLPESLCSLCNLQTLKAASCPNLTKLPRDMHKLANLRYLDIVGTHLERMPSLLCKLTSLQQLSDFIVTIEHNRSSIGELGELSNLHGSLAIKNLENVVDANDAMEAKLREKKFLEDLSLEWGYDTDDSQQKSNSVLDNLQPHTNLKELKILNYTGTEFPNWLGENSFCNLVSLFVMGCNNCQKLQPLGQLSSLKELRIKGFPQLVSVGSEFYGSSSSSAAFSPFASLEILRFEYMPAWEKWINDEIDNESCRPFQRLRELYIMGCPRLIGDLPDKLPCLMELVITDCKQLVSSLPTAPALSALRIEDAGNLEFPVQEPQCHQSLQSLKIFDSCVSLKSFPLNLFPRLKSLELSLCKNLESLTVSDGEEQQLTSLHSLYICKCRKFVSFPNGGLPAPNLTCFEVECCNNLELLPARMHILLPSLKELHLSRCPKIETFPDYEVSPLPVNLRSLEIRNCDKLIGNRLAWNLSSLTSLEDLIIKGKCEDLESFPDDGLLPVPLSKLEIGNFLSLKTLNSKGLRYLSSLKQLDISNCPKLESITEDGTPTSLIHLNIWNCPLLQEQCEREKGQQWPKIAHIPNICINHKFI
ncbi:Disease resistance protein [Quillaja saponaria]|uniref:Disease resistance protein n=1 Tax=Quillaja saponaria TaxID=32244 RepID=A0AAD7QIR0_QUISA|nr:Disease resistance protein [Quillaja saponaria]